MTLIVDLNIHKHAHLSREKFLERLKLIRTVSRNDGMSADAGLTMYIGSQAEFMRWEHIRSIIVHNDFRGLNSTYSAYGYVHTAIDVAEPLYDWFKGTDKDTMWSHIIIWLAMRACLDGDLGEFMKGQLYSPISEELDKAIDCFEPRAGHDDLPFEDRERIFHEAAKRYCRSTLPTLLRFPTSLNSPRNTEAENWRVHGSLNISVGRYFLQKSSWEAILTNKEDSTWNGGWESEPMWEKIKHQFLVGEPVFSFQPKALESGKVYLIRNTDNGHFKIGYSAGSPLDRMKQLQTGSSGLLEMFGEFPCRSADTERRVQDHFASVRLAGEWFRLSESQATAILDNEWRASNGIF